MFRQTENSVGGPRRKRKGGTARLPWAADPIVTLVEREGKRRSLIRRNSSRLGYPSLQWGCLIFFLSSSREQQGKCWGGQWEGTAQRHLSGYKSWMKSAWFGEAKDPLGVPANTPTNVTSIDLREPDLTGSHMSNIKRCPDT